MKVNNNNLPSKGHKNQTCSVSLEAGPARAAAWEDIMNFKKKMLSRS